MNSTSNEVAVPFQPARRIRADRAVHGRPTLQPARVARQLALAHVLQQRIDLGEFRNQAGMARALGFSRERISKLMHLLLLAPGIQEEILFVECAPGPQPLSELHLHQVLRSLVWDEQRRGWATVTGRGND